MSNYYVNSIMLNSINTQVQYCNLRKKSMKKALTNLPLDNVKNEASNNRKIVFVPTRLRLDTSTK